jgi:hypothetical protein
MNKVLASIGTLAAVCLVYLLISPSSSQKIQNGSSLSKDNQQTQTTSNTDHNSSTSDDTAGTEGGVSMTDEASEGEGIMDTSDRPATDLYSTASEALEAVQKGAKSYDDLILEQFVDLGANCSWCDEFYKSIRSMVSSTTSSPDERGYYAELLAISGRPENIEELIKNIESASSEENKDLYTQALEIAVGGDELVNFLNEKLQSTTSQSLRESLVASISNQSSVLTVETLYNFTRAQNNPDGFYSAGTGLGEVIPDEATFPFLKDVVAKRDEYSHLGVKALLNGGLEGVKTVVDLIAPSNGSENDRELLKNAADHVSFDEETEKYFKEVVISSNNPALAEWGKEVLASFNEEGDTNEDSSTNE